jgi:lipoprotein-anchoring transpeptidase ErfK/SrfK
MLAVATFLVMSSNFAGADSRNDAISTIITLRNSGVEHAAPEEMRSIDSAFLIAEQYYQNKEIDVSERYFLLAIQKAQVLLANLAARHPGKLAAEDASTPPPASVLPAVEPEVKSLAQPTIQQPIQPTLSQLQPQPSSEEEPLPTSDKLVGHISTYTVKRNENLRLIAAKLGVSRQHLAKTNRMDPNAPLKAGQKLRYNNLKIIPQRMTNGIVINIPDRTLYYFRQGKLAVSIPVALGVTKKTEKFDWKTPTGKFKIVAKQKDPTWIVPLSIRSEMEDEGKEAITSIPPGPTNPLGKYAIKTSIPGIMIHSTTKPGSIYSFASHGCIRVYPEHMAEIFKEIKVNTMGEIIYRPVKLAVTEQGRIFMEVHQDAYGKTAGLDAEAKQLIKKNRLTELVDWSKVESLIKLRSGIAEDVTL